MAVHYHQGQFPPRDLDWQALIPLLGPANAAVALYEGVLHAVPNPNVLLSPLTSQEAVLSSRIEGTQATLGEVLEFEAQGDLEDESTPKKADIHEVLNYRYALKEATTLLRDLPLSQRLLRQTHTVLMRGVRGRHRDPGEYRRVPNWIGPPGCLMADARYVSSSAEHLQENMAAFEQYLHSDQPDKLVQLAIAHVEFESIHPFLDGNGRLGRLMVPLFLCDKGLLSSPNFYISAYMDEHRDEYYSRLLAVSAEGDWTGWCRFFLQAIISQAESSKIKALAILALYRDRKAWIVDVTRSQHAVRALDWIFGRPIFKSPAFIEGSAIPKPTASRILRVLRDEGFLVEIREASGRRPAILACRKLMNIAEGVDAF